MKEFGNLIEGAAQSLVTRWENGTSIPNNERLKQLASIGGITVNELLYGDFKSYCYDVFNRMASSEKNMDQEKIKSSFEDGYKVISKLNLSYEDSEKIENIFKDAIDLNSFVYEYSNEGAVNYSINLIRDLYRSKILSYFFYEKDGEILERKNVDEDLADDISEIIEEAISKIENLKSKYSETNK